MKKFISVIITISIILSCMPVVYGENYDFIESPYTMISESFEGDILPQGFTGFTLNFEKALIGNDSAFHLENPLGGKIQISFQLLIDSLNENSKIAFCASDLKNVTETIFFEITFEKENKYSYNIVADNSVIANIPFGETVKLTMNVSTDLAELYVCDAIGNIYTHSVQKAVTLAFGGIHYSFDGNSYIKNFEISREDLFIDKVPVITDSGNIVTAGAKAVNSGVAPEKYTLYIAEYNSKTLTAIDTASITLDNGESEILEISLPKNTVSAAYKAFLFSEKLVPQAENAASVKTENYSEYIYSQKSVISGLTADITIDFENSSDLPVRVRIISDSDIIFENTYTKAQYENGINYEFPSDGIYTVHTLLCHDKSMILAAQTKFLVYTEFENDTFVFSAGKNYYLRNNEKISFDGAYIADGESYLPAEFYETVGIIIDDMSAIRGDITKEISSSEIFTSVPLYAPSEILGAFGYYTFSGNGVIVISNDEFWNGTVPDALTDYYKEIFLFHDFEGTVRNFSCFDWGTSSHLNSPEWYYSTDEAASGTTSVYINHSEKSFRGLFSSIYPKYDEECVGYRITFKMKASPDYSGNKAGLYAIFYDKSGGLSSKAYYITTPSSDSFTEYEVLIPKDEFLIQNYSQIQFILATTTKGSNAPYAGGVYFDDYKIERYLNTDALKVSKAVEYAEMFKNSILQDSFEETVSDNWSFYSWGSENPAHGTDASLSTDGEKSIYIAVPSDSFAGYSTKKNIGIDSPTKSIKVSADIYLSDDFSGGDASVRLLIYKDESSKGIVSGTQIGAPEKGKWTTCEFYFTSMLLSKYDIDSAKVLLRTSKSGNDAAGKAYFDNVKINEEYTLSTSIHSNITANNFASWYILGEEVVYSFDADSLSTAERIRGVVYNSANEIVGENTLSASKVCSDGWTYIPSEVGYYEVEFFAVQSDGSQIPIVVSYDAAYSTDVNTFELARRSFAVVKSETKPVSERNKKLFLSDGGTDTDTLALGNLIGFYGIRLHFMTWGATVGQVGIEDINDVYDWTTADSQVQNIKDAGYGGMTINILSTPKWAVPEDIQKLTGNTVAGIYNYNCYAPEDVAELEEFLKDLVERYGDDTLIWEFWNEPQMGDTAFWQDSPESFSEMMKIAYSAIKSVDPDAVVSIGGLGANSAYYTFYDTIINDPEVYNSFDMLAIHGEWDDSAKFRSIAAKKGYDKKPFWNSEGYYHAYYQNGVAADKTEQALYFVMNNMQHFKQGSEIITHFSSADYQPDEYRVFINSKKGSTHSMGLFRNYPYYEPKLGAVTAYNFYDIMEDDFAYVGEYTFSDTQKAVRFVNGGKAMLVLWNSVDSNFTLDETLSMCLEGAQIIDMEGRIFDGTVLNKKTMYFVTDIDEEKLNSLPYNENTALNSDFEEPYYTCVLKENANVDVTAELSNKRVFDPDAFSVDESVSMVTDGWVYKSNFDIARPDGFDASFAMSADENGIYLLVDVADNTHLANIDPADFSNGDSIEFAIDCAGEGDASDRAEFTAVLTPSGAVLYKKTAADTGASLPENCSPSGTYLSGSYVNITRENNLTRYMIYLPSNELYPYSYPGVDNCIMSSIVVNNCDSDGENCYLEWGSGLANNEASPDKYGKITFDCSLVVTQENGTVTLNGTIKSGAKVSMMVTSGTEVVYVDQAECNDFGVFSVDTPLNENSNYIFAVSGTGLNKNYYLNY